MPKKVLFTSESVTEGHPDKIADQISDAILDSILEQDPNGRVACETIVTTGQVHVFGEITTDAKVDIPRVIRKTIGTSGILMQVMDLTVKPVRFSFLWMNSLLISQWGWIILWNQRKLKRILMISEPAIRE